jgi:hypothetical protein
VAAVHLGAEGLERGGERVQRAPGVQGAHEAGGGVPHQPRLGGCKDSKEQSVATHDQPVICATSCYSKRVGRCDVGTGMPCTCHWGQHLTPEQAGCTNAQRFAEAFDKIAMARPAA